MSVPLTLHNRGQGAHFPRAWLHIMASFLCILNFKVNNLQKAKWKTIKFEKLAVASNYFIEYVLVKRPQCLWIRWIILVAIKALSTSSIKERRIYNYNNVIVTPNSMR